MINSFLFETILFFCFSQYSSLFFPQEQKFRLQNKMDELKDKGKKVVENIEGASSSMIQRWKANSREYISNFIGFFGEPLVSHRRACVPSRAQSRAISGHRSASRAKSRADKLESRSTSDVESSNADVFP
jgi:hypothetical protein